MKITKSSKILMSYFLENNCIQYSPKTAHADKSSELIVGTLYEELKEADHFVQSLKTKEKGKEKDKNKKKDNDDDFYQLKITKIVSSTQIPKPQMFNAASFPKEIREQIDEHATYDLCYTFSLLTRQIEIHFILEETETSIADLNIAQYNEYIDKILVWLYIVDDYASKLCSEKLTVFIYFTSLNKVLPSTSISILNQNNVNTAFTYTCPKVSEIIVYRKEEWFKVFMHETFHNFALDFSDMNTEACNQRILSVFKVESDVNLFEAYTEFWAKMWNAGFSSYYLREHKKDNDGNNGNNGKKEFLTNFDFFIQCERTFGFFQMVKALDFMGLKYADLYSKNAQSESMRDTLYKEQTNVLAYYIITTILINNYQGFLIWCDNNNTSLIQFKKTTSNLNSFCTFIEKNYKTKPMIQGVECAQLTLRDLNKHKTSTTMTSTSTSTLKKKDRDYLLKNMRMSINELG